VNIAIVPVIPVAVFEFKVEKAEEIRDATQISFIVKPIGTPIVKLSSEHKDFRWITKQELNNFEISKETRKVILKAFKLINIHDLQNEE